MEGGWGSGVTGVLANGVGLVMRQGRLGTVHMNSSGSLKIVP